MPFSSSPPVSLTPSRPHCPVCLRPLRACWCGCVRTVSSQVQLLVLQHPQYHGHAKNTARLLHLCLPGSRLEVGEQFADHDVQAWLHGPWHGQAPDAVVHPVLLYPPTPPDPQLPVIAPPDLPAVWRKQPQLLRLVVIDGTWRKSRKMLYLNPALQALPRWALHDVPPGRYTIRKAQRPGQLSSFEAAALALAQMHSAADAQALWVPLMASFEAAMQLHQGLEAAGRAAQSSSEAKSGVQHW